MSVIESGTAFEVFVENFLANAYRSLGKHRDKVEDIMIAGLDNLLKKHIRKVTRIDFSSSNQYKSWMQYAYNVRNDVVHRGRDVSAYESKIAVEINSATIKFISSLPRPQ